MDSRDRNTKQHRPWKSNRFANVKTALILFCIAAHLLHVVISGLLSMSISTLQYRFQLRSADMGYIASAQTICATIGMIVIVAVGENLDRPKWIGIGTAVAALGCICFGLPHFIAPRYVPIDEEDQNKICNNASEPACANTGVRNHGILFGVSFALIGIGTGPIFSHGIAYIDENNSKANSALYSSIFYAMCALGPAVGYIGGGATLKLYTYIGQQPDELTSESYAWVGAWWIGFVLCGSILIVAAIFIYLLPRNVPGTEELRKNRNDEMQTNNKIEDDELNKIANSLFKSMIYLFNNKCLILCIAGNALNFAFIFSFNTFGAKYFESQFGLKPFAASLLYGLSSIISAVCAQVISGIFLSKLRLNVQQIIKYMLICSIITGCCSFGIFIHCPDVKFGGATVPYHGSNETGLGSTCNANCTCSTDIYEPVCGSDGITYFSPCFAGCIDNNSNGSYVECDCIINKHINASKKDVADPGPCEQPYCKSLPLFMVLIILAMFTSVMTFTPSMQVTLRCVPFNLRVRAVGLNRILSYFCGMFPGQVITGYIVDLSCVAWRTECGSQGSCAVYNRWKMARNMATILLAETWCMVGVYVAMLYAYEPQVVEEIIDSKVEEITEAKRMIDSDKSGNL